MSDEAPSEPLFRANKRRKVFRRRDNPEEFDEGTSNRASTDGRAVITKQERAANDENGDGEMVRVLPRSGARKHGIGFSSAETRQLSQPEENTELAMVLANENESEQVPGSDRFVRPTGRIVATEDKHMYVPLPDG